MKLKKENVRKNILEAAKAEFFENGYKEANIRSIAERAGITPGNIYRYYESKEVLLDAIVGDTNKGICAITKLEHVIPSEINTPRLLANFFIDTALNTMIKNKYEVIILLSKSHGSKYEDSANRFIEFTAQSIDKTREESNIELSRIIAKAILYSEMNILSDNIDDESKIKTLSKEFLMSIFSSSIKNS